MINILRTCSFIFAAIIVFIGCRKVEDLPFYDKGNSVTLSASKTAVVATPADSNRSVINFNWTDPNYATESSNVKYLLQIDSAGRNFSRAVTREINGNRMDSLTGRELNAITLNYGFAPGSVHVLEARIISSYANNNERYTSNVVRINVTPFTDPSRLTSSTTTVTGTLATASQPAVTLSWSPSFPGYSGAITYTIQYDSAGKNFANPKILLQAVMC
jgi:starch-binding outer membrane protein SusE/F